MAIFEGVDRNRNIMITVAVVVIPLRGGLFVRNNLRKAHEFSRGGRLSWRPRLSSHTLLHSPAHRSPRPQNPHSPGLSQARRNFRSMSPRGFEARAVLPSASLNVLPFVT